MPTSAQAHTLTLRIFVLRSSRITIRWCRLRSRVVEVKRCIEAQVAVSVYALRLFGPWFGPKEQAAPHPQEMRDDLPLEEFGVTNGAVVTLRVERKQARPRGTGAGECEGVSLSVSSLEEE